MGNKKMTQKNNKLIAEFMGYKQHVYKNPYNSEKEIYYYKGNISDEKLDEMAEIYPSDTCHGKKTILKEFNYHSDWNDLMGVVEEIENLGYGINFEKTDNKVQFCWIWNNPDDNPVVAEFSNKKIDSVYKSIIEFIKSLKEK